MNKEGITPFYLFEADNEESPEVIPPQEEPEFEEEFYGYVTLLTITRVASTPGLSYSMVFNSLHVVNNLAGVFKNIFESNSLISDINWKDHFWELMTDPLGYFQVLVDKSTSEKCTNLRIYSGFDPKQKRLIHDSLLAWDPYTNSYLLDRVFTNPKKVFDNQVGGNKREELKNEDQIKKYFLQNPTEIYLLDNKPEIKERMLKELGIRDLGKIGKNLNLGLI